MIEQLKLKILEYFSPDPQADLSIKSLVPFGFTGMVLPHFTSVIPAGFILLDGATYNKDDYPDLWAFLSEDYSSTIFEVTADTFAVPDMRNRVPAGVGTETDFNALHKKAGAVAITLTTSQMPAHAHWTGWIPYSDTWIDWYTGNGIAYNGSESRKGLVYTNPGSTTSVGERQWTENTGSGGSHPNVQPSYAVHWIMKT